MKKSVGIRVRRPCHPCSIKKLFVNYKETLPLGIVVVPMQTNHAEQLEALQRIVFPDLAEEELLHADQYRRHVEIFPEGQFVALDGDKVVGATSTIRYHFDWDLDLGTKKIF